jgi:hypothetical protein
MGLSLETRKPDRKKKKEKKKKTGESRAGYGTHASPFPLNEKKKKSEKKESRRLQKNENGKREARKKTPIFTPEEPPNMRTKKQ